MKSSNGRLPVSVQICTLNEEDNIADCLAKVVSNNPAEIIVIDGGSTDPTVKLAQSYGATVIEAGRVGLGKQRQIGVLATAQPYIAVVDADDRLEPDCLPKLLAELNDNKLAAIQASVLSFSNETYLQTAWGLFCSLNINEVGKTTMVGRPAMYTRAAVLTANFDELFTYAGEDTDASYRFEKLGLPQGIGTGVSYRIHPTTFRDCKRKWISYGRGYARFGYRHPERNRGILRHIFWNIPFKRMWKTVTTGNGRYAPFYFLYGLYCAVGYLREREALKKGKIAIDHGRVVGPARGETGRD